MYSRLRIARDLLRDDGVIFISIDDHEVDTLKAMCNECFGLYNLVAEIPWQSRASIQNDTDFSINHEYICVYAKKRRFENRRLKESNSVEWHKKDSFVCRPLFLSMEKFDNPDHDKRGKWKADPLDAPNLRPNLTYPITNPNTGEQHLPPRGRHWRFSPEKFASALQDDRIVWTNNGKGRPQLKVFYEEKKEFGSIDNSWFSADKVGTSTNGTKELMRLFDGVSVFDTPKPTTLLIKLISLANVQDNDIILDFFSGSATTAHAVMKIDAEDGGHRKFIMVQYPEEYDPSKEAYKAGYKNICEIGKERIRRAGEKIKADHQDKPGIEDLDVGFRVLKVDSSNRNEVYYQAGDYNQSLLDQMAENIKGDRTELDLLFGCVLDWGLPLSQPYHSETIEDCTVHFYGGDEDGFGSLAACFAETISENVVTAIARRQPAQAVFKDSSFASSAEKLNVGELFKRISPDTSVKVI